MARKNRRDIVNESEVGVYLVSSRTVRRAFLMGNDPVTGRDRSYRKRVIEKRMEDLASVFAVEVCDYSIADNHSFAILRIRPDLVRGWDDREVARRWLRVNRSRLQLKPEPSADMIDRFVRNEERLGRARQVLSSLSEFMGCLKQAVACEANLRDEVTDNFWADRFQSVCLEDAAAVAAGSAYVNMHLIRAERAAGLEDSEYTSAYVRLRDEEASDGLGRAEERIIEERIIEERIIEERSIEERSIEERSIEERIIEERREAEGEPGEDGPTEELIAGQNEDQREGRMDWPSAGWLQPVDVIGKRGGYDGAAAGRRASNDGYVRLTFAEQRGVINLLLKYEQDVKLSRDSYLKPELPAVLERLGVSDERWILVVLETRRRFNRELELMEKRIAEAKELGLWSGAKRDLADRESG